MEKMNLGKERSSDGRVLICYIRWLREALIDNMSFNSRPERSDRVNGVCILVKSVLGRGNRMYKGLKAKGCQQG